jgi:hypothetical protein
MVWNGEPGRPDPDGGNFGWGNMFWFVNGQDGRIYFQWRDQLFWNVEGFSQTPGGMNSKYLSSAEKDYYSAIWGMPTSPQAAAVASSATEGFTTGNTSTAPNVATPAQVLTTLGPNSMALPSRPAAPAVTLTVAPTVLPTDGTARRSARP